MDTMKSYKVYWENHTSTNTKLSQYHYDHMITVSTVTKITPTRLYEIIYTDDAFSFTTLDKSDVIKLRNQKNIKSVKVTKTPYYPSLKH